MVDVPKIPWICRGKRLAILRSLSHTQGENLDWVSNNAGLSQTGLNYHVRQLSKFGYVYRARFNHPEIWLTAKGWDTLKKYPEPQEASNKIA